MRPLVITSSSAGEIHLVLKNLTAAGFKQKSFVLAESMGGAFQFTSLASALLQHLTCRDNTEYGAGCVAFMGGDMISIEDST